MPVFILLIVFGVGSSVLQNMPALVLNRIAPKAERISPMSGLKRIYGVQGLVEFGKSLFKIVIVSLIVVLVLENDFYESLDAMFADPMTLFARITKDINQILIVILFSTGVVAIVDFFWTRHHWYEQLRMSKQDLKDEMKQSQGIRSSRIASARCSATAPAAA